MDEKPEIRIFISSPYDVLPERLIAEGVVAGLNDLFEYHFRVVAVLWEQEPLLATHRFQDPRNIPPPHDADIVVVILWTRLGKPAGYPGPITGREVTGTEWEFEDALQAARINDVPALLLYRKLKLVDFVVSPVDDHDDSFEEAQRQRHLVNDFMDRWFGQSGPVTAASHRFETIEQFEEMLWEHLHAILEKRLGSRNFSKPIRWPGPPFRGLESFEPEHAQVFFGRRRARNEIRDRLEAQEARGRAFILVLGASGSGKSSLVKAGVLPHIMRPGMIGKVGFCRYAVMRPPASSNALVDALAAAVFSDKALPELTLLGYTPEWFAEQLRTSPANAVLPIKQGLVRAAQSAGLMPIAESRFILIVDQFEELFTIKELLDDERLRFIVALDALARSGLVWIIATMRNDFFDRLESFPALSELTDDNARYRLSSPTDVELSQMIRGPAGEAGLTFERDRRDGIRLDDRIRDAARNQRDALPLLSFVLDELWKQKTQHGLLTVEAYDRLGGLEGALAQRADGQFDKQPAAVRAALPHVLHELVTIGSQGEITSRAAPLAKFPPSSREQQLVEAFVAARLFVQDGDEATPEATVRVAHEALLTHWKEAKDYIEKNRADLQLESRLEEAALRWEKAAPKHRTSLLISPGFPLQEALDLARRKGRDISARLREFITRSRRAALWRSFSGAGVVFILAVLMAVSVSAYYIAERERSHALIAESHSLSHEALAAVERGDAMLGIVLALRALPRTIADPDRPFVREAQSALVSAIARQRQRIELTGHRGGVLSAAFSPDGNRVVTASDDHTAFLWDPKTGLLTGELVGHVDQVYSAAFSPSGKHVVTASRDKTARIWDAETGDLIARLRHPAAVLSAAFSPDGSRIVTGSTDHKLRLWEVRSRKLIKVLPGHLGSVWSAAFSPRGTLIVSASKDDTARLWNAITGVQVAVLGGHSGAVWAAAFSSDGTRVVTASSDNTARIWSVKTRATIAVLSGHQGAVLSAAFSPDGTRVLTASNDTTARLWDAKNGSSLAVLIGHGGKVWDAAFSPDGGRIVTASVDSSARVWEISDLERCQTLIDHARDIARERLTEVDSGRQERSDWSLFSFSAASEKCE
jgi:energy-coupling factor transporter ATP-binding protein EcfA2